MQGQLPEAAGTYDRIGQIDALGASYMASGLGDLALYQGRFSDQRYDVTSPGFVKSRLKKPLGPLNGMRKNLTSLKLREVKRTLQWHQISRLFSQ